MKKVIALAFVAVLAASCTKKEDKLQDSNVMLEEPKVEVKADSATAKPADQTTVAAAATPAADAKTAPAADHASGNTNAANSTGASGGTPNGAEQKGTPAANTAVKK